MVWVTKSYICFYITRVIFRLQWRNLCHYLLDMNVYFGACFHQLIDWFRLVICKTIYNHCPWVHKDYGTRGPGIVQMKTLKCLLVFIWELFFGAFGILIQHCLNMSSLVSMMACRLFSSEPLSKQVASQFLLFIHTSARPNAIRHTSGFPLNISQSFTAPVSDYQLWQCVGNTS